MRISIFILLAGIILSCNNTGSDPEATIEYPIITGTWKVNSPNDADWIGKQSKSKAVTMQADSTGSDSVYINRPDGQALKIYSTPKWLGEAAFSFVDSTTAIPNIKSDDENEGYYIDVGFSDKQYIQVGSYYLGDPIEFSDTFSFEIPIKSNCSMIAYGTEEPGNLPPPDNETMTITLTSQSTVTGIDTVKTYVVDIAGIKGVIDHIYCQ